MTCAATSQKLAAKLVIDEERELEGGVGSEKIVGAHGMTYASEGRLEPPLECFSYWCCWTSSSYPP